MKKTTEEKIYIGCQWFMALGAIFLLALFVRYTVGYFQSPDGYYCREITDANGNTMWAMCYDGTVWDNIVQSGWLFPFSLFFRITVAWFKWTFDYYYTDNILDMYLGMFTVPFWGYWIWIGINRLRGIGCI